MKNCSKPLKQNNFETISQYNTKVHDELKIRSKTNVYAFERDYFDGAHDLFIILRNMGLLKIN